MIKTGGPAFPQGGLQGARSGHGMTLRDYFAAKAMQAIIAKLPLHGHNSSSGVDAVDCNIIKRDIIRSEVCRGAYNYADAMIEARGKQDET